MVCYSDDRTKHNTKGQEKLLEKRHDIQTELMIMGWLSEGMV
jgi:hypothetical protein